MRIAFIGLGAMGAPMAAQLAEHEYVTGFDQSARAREKAASSGLRLSSTLEEAARGAVCVITMLQEGAQTLAVWRRALPLAKPDALFIDCSTIDIEEARQAHAMARAAGAQSIDAPVSGGVNGAAAGSLTFMCGGEAQAVAAARPVLERMGARVLHCGGPGLGQAAKLCNNLMLGATMAATAEAFALADKLGLETRALFEAASVSSGQSWSLTSYCPVAGPVPASPANRGYEAGFMTRLMLKDLRLAADAAARVGGVTPMRASASSLYAAFESEGGGDMDFSGIFTLLARRN
jgi:3-hydroxyisobutyrate dehydrogenase